MALFRLNLVWNDDSKNTLVYKYPLKNYGREINNKSTLTVKESQCAIFVHKGQIFPNLRVGNTAFRRPSPATFTS